MAAVMGIDIGRDHSAATILDASAGSQKPRPYPFKAPRVWGMFWTEDPVHPDPFQEDFRRSVGRLGDFAYVLAKKTLEAHLVPVDSLRFSATCPYGLTDDEVRYYASVLRDVGIPIEDGSIVPEPLAIAYETAISNNIDPDGMEFVLVDLDRFQCNVLVARLVMSEEFPSMAVRSLVPYRHPSHLEFDEYAYTYFEQTIASVTGLDPSNLATCWMDSVNLDIAFKNLKDGIYGGDVTLGLNLMSLEGGRSVPFTRERFALSVAQQSVEMAGAVTGALEMAGNGLTVSASESGLEPLSDWSDVDAFIFCGESPYVRFGSDITGCFVRETAGRSFIVDRPEMSASQGATMLFVK